MTSRPNRHPAATRHWANRLIPLLLVAGLSTILWTPQGATGAGEPGPGPTPGPTPPPYDCSNVCNKISYPPDARGKTICCNGKKIACVNHSHPDFHPPGDAAAQAIKDCVQRHEDHHAKDKKIKCSDQPGFRNPVPKGDDQEEQDCNFAKAECEAYEEQIKCLKEKLPTCGIDPKCQDKIWDEIISKTRQKDVDYCGPYAANCKPKCVFIGLLSFSGPTCPPPTPEPTPEPSPEPTSTPPPKEP